MKMGGRQGPRGGRGCDRGALGDAGRRLASVWRAAVAAGPRPRVGARGTWSTKPGASCKPRASLTAQEGVSACEAQHQTVRTGDSCPPWQRANGPGAKGRGRALGWAGSMLAVSVLSPVFAEWPLSILGGDSALGTQSASVTAGRSHRTQGSRANGPSGSERSRPGRPSRCFEGQKENALQSRP